MSIHRMPLWTRVMMGFLAMSMILGGLIMLILVGVHLMGSDSRRVDVVPSTPAPTQVFLPVILDGEKDTPSEATSPVAREERLLKNGENAFAPLSKARGVLGAGVFAFQVLALVLSLARASDEKRTPFGVLSGYFRSVTLLSSLWIAVVPLTWGYPLIMWSGGVIATTVIKAVSLVALTTSYYKLGKPENKKMTAHDDGAISEGLQQLTWGLIIALMMAAAWSILNLIRG